MNPHTHFSQLARYNVWATRRLLDAVTQVIEPFVSVKATPYTDALARPAIGLGIQALMRLMQGEDLEARDRIAWVSLSGGLALANAGLGAVHGLAGLIGGLTGAAHGAICGALLGPVLQANRATAYTLTVRDMLPWPAASSKNYHESHPEPLRPSVAR